MSVQYKPDGYHTITPYLVVEGAAEAITFLSQVFNATQVLRLDGPDGRIGHARQRLQRPLDPRLARGARHPGDRKGLRGGTWRRRGDPHASRPRRAAVPGLLYRLA